MASPRDQHFLREQLDWSREVREFLAALEGDDLAAIRRTGIAALRILPPGSADDCRAAIRRMLAAASVALDPAPGEHLDH